MQFNYTWPFNRTFETIHTMHHSRAFPITIICPLVMFSFVPTLHSLHGYYSKSHKVAAGKISLSVNQDHRVHHMNCMGHCHGSLSLARRSFYKFRVLSWKLVIKASHALMLKVPSYYIVAVGYSKQCRIVRAWKAIFSIHHLLPK